MGETTKGSVERTGEEKITSKCSNTVCWDWEIRDENSKVLVEQVGFELGWK